MQTRDDQKTIFVRLPVPPSVNHLYPTVAGGKRVKSEEYKQWLASCAWEVIRVRNKARKMGYFPDPPYRLEIELHFPDARRRDASNYIKAVEDLLAEYLHYDDKLNYELLIRKRVNRHSPCVEVRLLHLKGKTIKDTIPPRSLNIP